MRVSFLCAGLRFIVFGACLFAAAAPAVAAPHIDFVETTQHIGKMEQHTSREATFRYVNTGDEPLIIEKAEST